MYLFFSGQSHAEECCCFRRLLPKMLSFRDRPSTEVFPCVYMFFFFCLLFFRSPPCALRRLSSPLLFVVCTSTAEDVAALQRQIVGRSFRDWSRGTVASECRDNGVPASLAYRVCLPRDLPCFHLKPWLTRCVPCACGFPRDLPCFQQKNRERFRAKDRVLRQILSVETSCSIEPARF